VTAEQQSAIEAVLRRIDPKSRLRERLEMVKAASQGYDLEAIAIWRPIPISLRSGIGVVSNQRCQQLG
jgi:hypothetical protein